MIVDSNMRREDALKQNPAFLCPKSILDAQRLLTVWHLGFDGQMHEGRIVIHRDLVDDLIDLFALIRKTGFPLTSVIPVADARFAWSDDASMAADNSSGFNYRTIAGMTKLSMHAYGRAFDLNPRRNPYIRGALVQPPGAVYDPSAPGTLTPECEIVRFLEARGWEWGGRWDPNDAKGRVDYQHFQKDA